MAACQDDHVGGPAPTATIASDKTAECAALTLAIHEGTEKLARSQRASDAPPDEVLRGIAEAADASRDAVTQVPLSLPDLRAFAADYARMCEDIARNARAAAVAVPRLDLDAVERASTAMDEASKRETPIVDGIRAFCGR